MGSRVLVAIASLLILAGMLFAQQPQLQSPSEKNVREVISSLESAWNRRDGTTYGGAFSEDGDLVLPNGMRVNGKKAIINGQNLALKSIYLDSHIVAKVETVRLLRPDIAIAHVTWLLKYKLSDSESNLPMNSTITLAKGGDGKWVIEAFQATPIL